MANGVNGSMFDSYLTTDYQTKVSSNTSNTNTQSFDDTSIFTQATAQPSSDSSTYENIIKEFNETIAKNAKEREEQEAKAAAEEKAKAEAEKETKADKANKADKADDVNEADDPNKTDDPSEPENEEEIAEVQTSDREKLREDFDEYSIASSLHSAMKDGLFGWGTNDEIVAKYLEGTDNYEALNEAELRTVAAVYEEKYGQSLEDAIRGDFSGKDEDKYVAKLKNAQENYDEIKNLSAEDKKTFIKQHASKFFDATHKLGTDEETVWQIMQMSPSDLKELIKYYDESGYADKRDFKTTIEKEFSGGAKTELYNLYNEAMGYNA